MTLIVIKSSRQYANALNDRTRIWKLSAGVQRHSFAPFKFHLHIQWNISVNVYIFGFSNLLKFQNLVISNCNVFTLKAWQTGKCLAKSRDRCCRKSCVASQVRILPAYTSSWKNINDRNEQKPIQRYRWMSRSQLRR